MNCGEVNTLRGFGSSFKYFELIQSNIARKPDLFFS